MLETLGDAPVAVLTITGLGSTGKSFLLNQLLGRDNARESDGFIMADRRGTGTQGVWACVVPPERWQYDEAPSTRLLLLDTEGLGQDGWDAKCFSLSVLLSSLLVYNSLGEIDDAAIEQLYHVAELTERIRVSAAAAGGAGGGRGDVLLADDYRDGSPRARERADAGRTTEDTLARHTPAFLWMLRDCEIGSRELEAASTATLQRHMETALEDKKREHQRGERGGRSPIGGLMGRGGGALSPRVQEQNKTRSAMRALFPTRYCRALVAPVSRTADLDQLAELQPRQLQDQFRRQMRVVKDDLFRLVKPKQLFGQTVSGRLLLSVTRSYLDDMNRRKVPDIRKAWDSSEGSVLDDVYAEAKDHYFKGLEQKCGVKEETFLFECIHPAGVTEHKDLESGSGQSFPPNSHHPHIILTSSSPHLVTGSAPPTLIAQIEEGETIEAIERQTVERRDSGADGRGVKHTVERIRTHVGWVSKEHGQQRLFFAVDHIEEGREKITQKQVQDCLRHINSLLVGDIAGVNQRNADRKKAISLCEVAWEGCNTKGMTEAATAEWSKAAVAEITKKLRHYTKLRAYDCREQDIPIMVNLLQDLSELRWYAPTDTATTPGVLGATTAATPRGEDQEREDFFSTTLHKPARGGFGMNIGTNCEVLDFNRRATESKTVAEVAGVLSGMTIIEVNGTPVYNKQGVTTAIQRGSSAKTLFKFRRPSWRGSVPAAQGAGSTSTALTRSPVRTPAIYRCL